MYKDNALEKLSIFFVKMAKFFVKLAIYFIVIYFLGMQCFKFGRKLFYEKAIDSGDGKEIVFEIKKGDSVDVIAKNLKNAGLIDDELLFKFRAKIYKTKFTPNAYNLKTSMTIKNMLDVFDKPSEEDIAVTAVDDSIYQLAPEEDEEETADAE